MEALFTEPPRCFAGPVLRLIALCGRSSKVQNLGYESNAEAHAHDYLQEWITPQPSRRPDIFPEFDKQTTPMPKPMPGDPELPDEEEGGPMNPDVLLLEMLRVAPLHVHRFGS